MKNKTLLEEIATNTTIIDYHIKRLKKKPDELHELDIELICDKLKEIYKQVHTLEFGEIVNMPPKDIEIAVPVAEQKEEIQEEEIAAPVAEQKEEIQEEEKAAPVADQKEEVLPEAKAEPEPEPERSSEFGVRNSELSETAEIKVEVMEEVEEEKPVEPAAEEITEEIPEPEQEEVEVSVDEIPAPKTTADLFSGATTIADAFQKEEDNSIAANINHQPVTDMKMAIGINDKFLFINELFKGNPAEYNEAIEKLNTAGDIEEANAVFNNYGQALGWNETSAAFARLNKIVHAKFS